MTTSYCCECDALPGKCDHTGPRYLDDVVYEAASDGWRVPTHELDRWANPPRVTRSLPPVQEPKQVQRLVVELEAWLDLDVAVETQLRAAYEAEPMRVTRAVEKIVRDTEAGRLVNPGGLLVKRLREITSKSHAKAEA